MIISVMCQCGAEWDVEVEFDGGFCVPYGSASVRTPSAASAEIIEQRCLCPRDEASDLVIEEQALAQAEDYEEPSRYDTTAERDMDRWD